MGPGRFATLDTGTLTKRSELAEMRRGGRGNIGQGYKLSYCGKANSKGVTIAVTYASQSGCDDVEKEQIWTELQDHIEASPRRSNPPLWRPVWSRWWRSEWLLLPWQQQIRIRNENGRLCKSPSYKCNRGQKSQADFALVCRRDLCSISDAMVIPSDCLLPQHK
ncbi:hypothetical protein COOONC_00564, partial [Cooperia oncophora]